MSLLERFLGGGRSKAYTDGMALLSEGRFAEAIDQLRVASVGRSDAPSGSLASFHFRQALVGEGRRLIRAGKFHDACQPLGEAARLWDPYPDLHFLHGTALCFAGQWDEALVCAHTALRTNPDYVEARLLAAVSLVHLGREIEAADNLNALVESGRRGGHWLVSALEQPQQFTGQSLPETLDDLLLQGASGRTEKEEVAEAVTFCRAGDWHKGLEKFTSLVAKRPRYPDYRTRLAAALFQIGRMDEALTEAEAALSLNENYTTAIDLKGLILADRGQFLDAREFLASADGKNKSTQKSSSAHEELFGAYLRAVLAMLTGDPEAVHGFLDGWPELGRTFARAELLLAAADDLLDRSATCGRRLNDLAEEWAGESLYFFFLAAHLLENRQYEEVSGVLSRWPHSQHNDLRPMYLECHLALCQGRAPVLPSSELLDSCCTGQESSSTPELMPISPLAWDYLKARTDYLAGRDQQCWQACHDLYQAGQASEKTIRLQLGAATKLRHAPDGSWREGKVLPQSCLAQAVFLMLCQDDRKRVDDLLKIQTGVHPEILLGYWLSPGFWLDPIRGWIA